MTPEDLAKWHNERLKDAHEAARIAAEDAASSAAGWPRDRAERKADEAKRLVKFHADAIALIGELVAARVSKAKT